MMKKLHRFSAAIVLSGLVAGGMVLGTARVEAKGKGGGGGGNVQEAVCSYLLSVITYPNVNETIKAYAISLYVAAGCDTSLIG